MLKLTVCAACHTHLVEEWTVRYGNTQQGEAPAEHHVIWSIIAVAAAAAGQEPGHSRFAEHHPAEVQTVSTQTSKGSKNMFLTSSPHTHIPESASPSAPCGVAVSIVKQAIAVSLPQAHCFLRVVAAQQPAQPGQAGQNTHRSAAGSGTF